MRKSREENMIEDEVLDTIIYSPNGEILDAMIDDQADNGNNGTKSSTLKK